MGLWRQIKHPQKWNTLFWKLHRIVTGHAGFEPSKSTYTAPEYYSGNIHCLSWVLWCGADYMVCEREEKLMKWHLGKEGPGWTSSFSTLLPSLWEQREGRHSSWGRENCLCIESSHKEGRALCLDSRGLQLHKQAEWEEMKGSPKTAARGRILNVLLAVLCLPRSACRAAGWMNRWFLHLQETVGGIFWHKHGSLITCDLFALRGQVFWRCRVFGIAVALAVSVSVSADSLL